MITDDDFVDFLLHSTVSGQSVEAVRPDFERWRGFLESIGVTDLAPFRSSKNAADDRAASAVCLLALQAAPHKGDHRWGRLTHELRAVLGSRPWKL
jgi:hypothetical protein